MEQTREKLTPPTQSERLASRRSFLFRSAAAGGALTLASLPFGKAWADHATPDPGCADECNDDRFTDLEILNYALTLEHLEAAFYTQGLAHFGSKVFSQGNIGPRGAGNFIRDTLFSKLLQIRDHEVAHVQTLISVIQSLGGNPVEACTYNFSAAFSSVNAFLQTAMVLENTGVMAYDGAIKYLDRDALQQAGATIATVEARHAAYLNLVNGENPFPSAFDTPKEPEEILQAAGRFIASC